MPLGFSIRAARVDELALLIEIERRAGAGFRSLGMDLVADDDPGSPRGLRPYAEEGRAFVAVDAADEPLAYVLVEIVDGAAHIEQVSVDPAHSGQKIGRALIERVETWARSRELSALTLTTYRDVPWNGPYYERLGFRYLTEDEETPGLQAIRDRERRHGLDAWPRACMQRLI